MFLLMDDYIEMISSPSGMTEDFLMCQFDFRENFFSLLRIRRPPVMQVKALVLQKRMSGKMIERVTATARVQGMCF